MNFTLPVLPFAVGALGARRMCQETLELHHGKHHASYVKALNGLVEKNAALQGKSLEDLIRLSNGTASMQSVFNNAGQHFNHSAFWESLSPDGGGIPGALDKKLGEDFGGAAQFKDQFKAAALGQFGSGWAWLVLASDGKLKIHASSNADNPVATGAGKALLVLDVWEHAYYVDFRNRRADFTDNFLDKLANYDSAAAKLRKA